MRVVVATIREWNIKNFYRLKDKFSDIEWLLIDDPLELTYQKLVSFSPNYIFFPHWSWKIPQEIYTNFLSIMFHMTDLPYGRGGSPLQNLILAKRYQTKITALMVHEELDSGDILLKRDLDITLGSAEEIFMRISDIIFFDMIPYIITHNLTPQKQQGEVVLFRRRKEAQSDILKSDFASLKDFYDFVRMLDAPGYPKAYCDLGKIKIEFEEVHLKSDRVVGRFVAYEKDTHSSGSS